jgi:hypothetical protein
LVPEKNQQYHIFHFLVIALKNAKNCYFSLVRTLELSFIIGFFPDLHTTYITIGAETQYLFIHIAKLVLRVMALETVNLLFFDLLLCTSNFIYVSKIFKLAHNLYHHNITIPMKNQQYHIFHF